MNDPKSITGYHAHIYYPDPASRERAAVVREAVDSHFDVRLGRWRDQPVGPHPVPMYQVAFAPDQFPKVVPWLMLNRAELTVLVHPETGDQIADHTINALWLGQVLELDIEFLRHSDSA